jgi:hypothetical protein
MYVTAMPERSLELQVTNLVKGSKRLQWPTTAGCGNQMTILQLCVPPTERLPTQLLSREQ